MDAETKRLLHTIRNASASPIVETYDSTTDSLEAIRNAITSLDNAVPEINDVIIYPVAEDISTTVLSDDGTSPAYMPAAAHSTAAVGVGAAAAAWTEDINLDQLGTITLISIYAEFEWQTRFLIGAGNGVSTNSKVQVSSNGGGAWVDITDVYTHSAATMATRIRAGVGLWITGITAGANQLQFRLLHWVDSGTGVSTSEAQIRSNSYVRLTTRKS